MDPASIPLPPPTLTTVPFTLEPDNHVPPVAKDIPNPAAATNQNQNQNQNHHPPYAEMIYRAIEALKEKDGSSKRAIGKYIEQVYKDNLPPTHSSLLTHNLKRLKSNGLLVMVKKSYKLPSSLPPPPTLTPRSDPSPTPQTQRGRGRPPKPKPYHQQNAEPVFVALGLADDPAAPASPTTDLNKRGPGRPPKIGVVGVGPAVPVRRGRPPGTARSRLPKRPGRPPKPKSVSAISNGLKRRPGRPPKLQSQPTVIPFAAPAPFVDTGVLPTVPVGSPRPRGRPRKSATAVPGVGAPAPPIVAPLMRQGRPPKLPVGRPKNSTGRPVGRPKGASAATAAQKVANEDLKRKLEYFQSKVKESLGVLKPYFNHESPVTAIAAIQELEILATLDLKAPIRDVTQQFPQQLPPQQQLQHEQQQLPQAQMYQQQYLQIPQQSQLQQLFQSHTSAPS